VSTANPDESEANRIRRSRTVDTKGVFCANPACADRGVSDKGNIKIHSRKERRFRCLACGKTFAATSGTPFFRLRKEAVLLVCVVTLLAHGCPLPAVVAAFGLDERTVADWRDKAGSHCEAVHQRHLETKPLDLGHVQADELYAKRQGGRSWVAMAMAVPSRLWLGGVVSPIRDMRLIERLVALVRLAWLPGTALLVCVDGLASYVSAFWRAFREKVMTGKRGRPPYRMPDVVWLAQVVKRRVGRCLSEVVRRVVWGTLAQVLGQMARTKTGEQINTSYIERLNATFRACLAGLTRRGRRLVKDEEVLEKGMHLVGCVYNFCDTHRSLRVKQAKGKKWAERTPAMAAGWTDHAWSVRELLSFRVFHV
jgi:transposase-like protein